MRRLCCFTLGFFLLTVEAEKEAFQGYRAEKTKCSTVTKDLPLTKENTIGHGTAAILTEKTLHHTALAVSAKFAGAILFHARPTSSYETAQITKASGLIASQREKHLVSRNEQTSLTSTRDNPSAAKIHTESEIPLISNYERIIFSPTQATFESMMNSTSGPDVHLSADAAKASLWLRSLLDNRNQRNKGSITLTSADGGPGVPVLSASHPRVIDNPAVLREGNDDKRSQGKDEKGISNTGRNEDVFGTMQSVSQSDTAGAGDTVTSPCSTCMKDRRLMSTEKGDGSSGSLSTEGLAVGFSQFTTSLPSLQQQSVGEEQQLVYKPTVPPLSLNKTENLSQSNLSKSQIKSFPLDRTTVVFNTRPLAEMSLTQARHSYQGEISVTERPIATTTALYHSSKSLHTGRKPAKSGEQELAGKKASVGNTQSKMLHLSKNNKNVSPSFPTNFMNVFIQNQHLDVSRGSVSSTPAIAEASLSSQESFLPKSTDYSAASQPTAHMRLIEDHSAMTSFSFRSPTTSAVKHPFSHSLTAQSLISLLKSLVPARPNSQTKQPMLTLLVKGSGIDFTSVTTKTQPTDPQDSHTSSTANSIVKHSFVDTQKPASKLVMKGPQKPTFTTKSVPVKFLPESRQDFADDASEVTLTAPSSKSLLTTSRLLGSQSKITQKRNVDVSSDNHMGSTRQSFVEYIRDLKRESLIVHNLPLGDENEQVLTVIEDDEDKEIITTEDEQGEEKETKELLKLQEEEESRKNETFGSKREEKSRSDKTENTKQDKPIIGVEIKQSTEQEEGKIEEHKAKTCSEEGGWTEGEEDIKLRHHQNARQGGVRDEEDVTEKQRESLAKGGEETVSNEDIKYNKEMRREDMTNVPLGPTTNTKDFNRDKGHTVTNLSPCHRLMKQLVATEHRGIQLDENIVEMKHKPSSNKVTRNHRPLRSTLRSQSPKLSRMTSFPNEPRASIKPHPHDGVAETTFPVTATPEMTPRLSDGTSKFHNVLRHTISPRGSASKLAYPGLNSSSNILSLTRPRVAVTTGFLQTHPVLTVNRSTLSASIIYSTSNRRHKFNPSTYSLPQTMNEREQAEHMKPAHIVLSSANSLVLPQQVNYDSSPRPPTTRPLSVVAQISTGQLQPYQRQSPPQIIQSSSSFDTTSGQPCSFKLTEQASHPDALHAPVDDNKQRSVPTLMTSMSPTAKSNQFPLSSMSPRLNLVQFGGDSSPGTYSLTGITRSASEKVILRDKSEAEYENRGRGHMESLSGTADRTNQTEENDNVQTTATLANAGKHTDERNRLSQLEGYNARSTKPVIFAVQTTQRTELVTDEDFVPATRDFVIPVFGSNEQNGAIAVIESESLPKIPQMQTNDVTHNVISLMERHAAKPSEKHHHPPTPRGTGGDSPLPVARYNFRSDPNVSSISTQQFSDRAMNVTSDLKTDTTKTNDFVSLAPAAPTGGLVSTKAHESALTTGESMKVVIEKLSQAAHAERTELWPNVEPLLLREPLRTPTTSKLPPVVKRNNTTERQSVVEEPEHEISVQNFEQSQHTQPYRVTEITQPINDPSPGIQISLLNAAHRAERAHETTPTMVVTYASIKDVKSALRTTRTFEARPPHHERTPQGRVGQHEKHVLSEKTLINQQILGAKSDSVPPTVILPLEFINKTSCSTIGCAVSGETSKAIGADEITHTAPEKMYKTQSGNTGKEHFSAARIPDTSTEKNNCSTGCSVPGKATPQATDLDYAVISPATSTSDHGYAPVDVTKNAKSLTSATKTHRVLLETYHLERLVQAQLAEKTAQRQSHREASEVQEAIAAEVTSAEPEAGTAQTTVETTERTLLRDKKAKTQLNRRAAKAEIFEAQNASRSALAVSKRETEAQEFGRRLLLPKPQSESELPGLKHRRRLSPHLYLSGVTEVSDDLCGSGNYTAEMSLNVGRGVEPGDAVPAMENLRVVINLKTNNSRINLEVTSCCLSPTIQPDFTANTTCCFFSRLAAEPAGITMLPSALSTSASFTISLFQMINYSVVYLHCDLSVCLRNRSDCAKQCLQQRSAFPLEGPELAAPNLRNRISFGPMLKDVKNSTLPKEIDPRSELDLVLVIVSLVASSSLVTVMLLLVWLAYRRRAVWLFQSAAPPRACCGCLRPGGDLILP